MPCSSRVSDRKRSMALARAFHNLKLKPIESRLHREHRKHLQLESTGHDFCIRWKRTPSCSLFWCANVDDAGSQMPASKTSETCCQMFMVTLRWWPTFWKEGGKIPFQTFETFVCPVVHILKWLESLADDVTSVDLLVLNECWEEYQPLRMLVWMHMWFMGQTETGHDIYFVGSSVSSSLL